MISIIRVILEQGLIIALVVCGVFLTARVIRVDDLTVEGSFGSGGAIAGLGARLALGPEVSVCGALIAGALAGLVTGLLHTKLSINSLMSGIIVTTALYSINLKLAGAHVPLPSASRLFVADAFWCGLPVTLLVLLCITVCFIGGVVWLLSTEVGFLLRAVGANPHILTSLGKNADACKIGMLMLANAMIGLAGALFAHHLGFFSLASSVGMMVIAWSGLTLSDLVGRWRVVGLLLGSFLFPSILAIIFGLQLDAAWNKCAIALAITGLLLLRRKQLVVRGR